MAATGTSYFHDTAGCRFVVKVGGDEAFVAYSVDEGARTIDLQHTFTPPALRGQGMAAKVSCSLANPRALARPEGVLT